MKKFAYRESLHLLESSKSGKTWKVMLIEEGLSKNGKYYPGKVLEKAKDLFEQAKAFYYEWKGKHYDHIPEVIEKIRPEGFPRQIAGWYDNVKYETVTIEGQKKTGLTALLHIHEGSKWLAEMLTSSWGKGMKKLLGLSINAAGPSQIRMASGRPIDVVGAIEKVFGVDIVTQPAAGGQLLKLVASQNNNLKESLRMFEEIIKLLKETRPDLLEGYDIDNLTEAQVAEIFSKLLETDETKEAKKKKEDDEKAKAKKKEVEEAEKKKKEADELTAEEKKKEEEKKEKEKKDAEKKESEEANKIQEALVKALLEGKDGKPNLEPVIALLKKNNAPLAMSILQKLLKKDEEPEKEAKKKKKVDVDEEKLTKEKEAITKREKELESKLAAIEKKVHDRELSEMLKILLDESKLPEVIRTKVEKRFKNTTFKESEIKDSIKEEKDVLAKLSESGDIVDLGDEKMAEVNISLGTTAKDRLQASTALLIDDRIDDNEKPEFDGITPFKSIKEAYIKITGDTDITGKIPAKRLHETVPTWDSADFTKIMGYTLGRRLLKEYKGIAPLWRDLATVISVKDFKMQEVIRWGGFGTLPTVISARSTQGTSTDTSTPTYADLGFATETSQLYALATKGGMLTVTRRMIINDDTQALKRIPSMVGKAAARSLNQYVFDLMLNYTTAINSGAKWPDGAGTVNQIALYHTNHMNTQSTAMGWDGINNMLTRLYNQCELGYKTAWSGTCTAGAGAKNVTTDQGAPFIKAGDFLWSEGEIMSVDSVSNDAITVTRGLYGTTDAEHAASDEVFVITQFLGLGESAKPTLWVPKALKGSAGEYINSPTRSDTAERAGNELHDAATVKSSPYLRGDTNNYYITADKNEVEIVELAFLNGKEEPEILIQDSPTAGDVFVYDVTRYKIRHEYGGAVPDYVGLQASIVT